MSSYKCFRPKPVSPPVRITAGFNRQIATALTAIQTETATLIETATQTETSTSIETATEISMGTLTSTPTPE